MSDLSETDSESYVICKICNIIIIDSIIRDREEVIWPKTALQRLAASYLPS